MRPTRVQAKTAGVVIGIVIALAACGRSDDPSPPATAGAAGTALPWGRSFVSTDVTENGAHKELIEGTQLTIEFAEDHRLIANAGCNSLSGPASADGDQLVVINAGMTELGCEPYAPHAAQDEWLGGFIRSRPRWTLQGMKLALDNGSTRILLEDRKVSQPDQALRGTRWVVDTIIFEGGAASSIPSGVAAYLEFADDGRVVGSGGCNSLSGVSRLDEANAAITFADIRSTKMGCDEARTQVELAVHFTLRGRVSFKIDRDKLVLTSPDGQGLHLRAAR